VVFLTYVDLVSEVSFVVLAVSVSSSFLVLHFSSSFSIHSSNFQGFFQSLIQVNEPHGFWKRLM